MTPPPEALRTLVIDKDLAHPPEKIWRALTQSSLLAEWLMTNDFLPVVGHKFTLRAPPMPHWDGVIACEVLVIEAPHRIAYSWNALGLKSVVTWTLTPTATGTRVRMAQAGFQSEADANYKGASYGWQKFLGGLERVVGGLDSL